MEGEKGQIFMAANKASGISDEMLDQLLVGHDPARVFESGGLLDELKKRLAERRNGAPPGGGGGARSRQSPQRL